MESAIHNEMMSWPYVLAKGGEHTKKKLFHIWISFYQERLKFLWELNWVHRKPIIILELSSTISFPKKWNVSESQAFYRTHSKVPCCEHQIPHIGLPAYRPSSHKDSPDRLPGMTPDQFHLHRWGQAHGAAVRGQLNHTHIEPHLFDPSSQCSSSEAPLSEAGADSGKYPPSSPHSMRRSPQHHASCK